ncbi:aldehyde dehydrogenase family protein [Frankia sp. CNm7]|uniref:Aldehyde dehydrogenase family protein n=1 Tax=Frankia nepalensis TaxID=1836974 RepID=A0A937UQQ2_9ACTN|nr:aldehyde dehydrogenase family protein [Frankia nepalensis]MBL7497757.1 aldehyde dehydrogenase family protein [Frankia nepalensis]MBL7512017.1 aldehyde dehydrogenase family protein [Frankia nepalensis]MBL7520355.1 aldehyde dehydrogenase family protein [Frankia nepalensis]MBL7632069.1 aldehyde dehydrogenase family protein [Frankia nepalensis]
MTRSGDVFVDGEWSAGAGAPRVVRDAATDEALDTVRLGERADVDRAVDAARAALPAWSATSPQERAERLAAMARHLKENARKTSELVSRENGMPISLSATANGYAPMAIFRYYAGLISDVLWEEFRPAMFGGRSAVERKPVGVVAAVVPWNYPQSLAAMKVAPALAAGCTVVLKTAPETPLDARVFAEAALAAGLAPGALNIVPADREVSAYLVAHPGVDKVAFTGSTAAGRAIARACGELLRPVTLELGGKSAAILTDEVDLDVFTAKLLDVCLPNSGQTCHASTRILAPRARYAEVVARVSDVVASYVIGSPLDRKTQIGPLASPAQRDRVLAHIAAGRRTAARLVVGGEALPGPGNFVRPAVFADVAPDTAIAREEVFGPVLCVLPYDGLDDAVALANDSDFGLAATVWGGDEDDALALARRLETGTVGVNDYVIDFASPFGGVKASGLGRELGPEGLDAYLLKQAVYGLA